MLPALRSVRTQPPSLFTSPLPYYSIGRKISGVSFRQAMADSKKEDSLDKKENPMKTADVMDHSFGPGYSTRSDEEGFGGVYGGNQTIIDKMTAKTNHHEYEDDQGSEVKEKEHGRNAPRERTNS